MDTLSSEQLARRVFDKIIKRFNGEDVGLTKYPVVPIAFKVKADFSVECGFGGYEKVFFINDCIIALGSVIPKRPITDPYVCDISIMSLYGDFSTENICYLLEENAFHESSVLIALSDGGIASMLDFFGKTFEEESFRKNVINGFIYSAPTQCHSHV